MIMFTEIKVKFEYNWNKKLKLKREVVKKLSKLQSRNNKGLEYMNKTLRKQGREIKKKKFNICLNQIGSQSGAVLPSRGHFGLSQLSRSRGYTSRHLVAGSQGGC